MMLDSISFSSSKTTKYKCASIFCLGLSIQINFVSRVLIQSHLRVLFGQCWLLMRWLELLSHLLSFCSLSLKWISFLIYSLLHIHWLIVKILALYVQLFRAPLPELMFLMFIYLQSEEHFQQRRDHWKHHINPLTDPLYLV